MFLEHVSIQLVAHAFGFFCSNLSEDLIWIDAVSGVSLFGSAVYSIAMHKKHPIVGVLFCIWSVRLSAHFIARRWLLGRVKARTVASTSFETMSFAVSRLLWSITVIITMHMVPTGDFSVRVDCTIFALLFLVLEAYADYELLKFRFLTSANHSLYTKGLWSISRHPNMVGELGFHLSICILVFDRRYIIASCASFVVTALSILLFSGGIQTLEERAKNTWGRTDEYKRYKETTALFIPYKKVTFNVS